MAPLSDVPWPPAPITTERLRLRPTTGSDRPGYVELFCDAEARRYLGGPLDEVEIGYPFLPTSWGHGYATEAVAAVLCWAATHLPPEPMVLCPQVANEASMRLAARLGFREVARFVEYDAEQWFGVRD